MLVPDDFDPLSQLPEAPPTKGRRVADPTLGRAGKSQAASVTAPKEAAIPRSMKAGDYVRQTITIPPTQRDLLKQLAKDNQVSLLSFYRWLLDKGLQAYENGDRPQPAEPVYREVQMGHWSSKGSS